MKKLNDIPAIILAGGFGKRIKNVNNNIPKPLIKVGDKNLLEHNILALKKEGIKEIIISIYHKGEMIKEFFGNGSKYGLKIDYIEDPYPLGDAGAFKQIYKKMNGISILTNADEIREGLNLEEMLEFHLIKKAISTMSVIEQPDIVNHGIVELNSRKRITKFLMNPSLDDTPSNYTNSGLYIVENTILKYIPEGFSMMKDVLKDIIKSKKLYGFIYKGDYFNVGTPELLDGARDYFKKSK